jgi:hypothetical protein
VKIIRESADTLCMPGTYIGPNQCNNSRKIAKFDDPDSHAFGIDRDHARMKVSKSGEDHVQMDKDYEQELGYDEYAENVHEGRLWKDKKIISFWDSPKPEHLEKIIRAIEKELKRKEGINLQMWDDPEWKIEVMVSPETGERVYNSKISSILPIQYMTEYIPFKEYTGTKNPDRVEHEKSPLLRKKKEVPYGFGSKHPKSEARNKWKMAKPFESFVPESLYEAIEFERGKDPKETMNIGSSALKVHRCGYCGAFTDEAGNKLNPDSKEFEVAKKFSEMPSTETMKVVCDDCYDDMIYQEEMEAQSREEELQAAAEAEAQWRSQEFGDYDPPYGYY